MMMKTGADPIDWQDIRLVAGEGKLSATDVYAAVEVILRQRREQPLRDKLIAQVNQDKNRV